MVGIVRIVLYSRVLFILVLKMVVIVVGFGCGGRKLWVIDSVVVIGILIYSSGIFVEVVMVNISGSISIKFILQNRVKLMVKLVSIIVYWMCFLLNLVISVVVICCVLLQFVSILFSIVLKFMIRVRLLSVLLILVLMELIILFSGIFCINLIVSVMRMRVMKLFILKWIIRSNNKIILIVIMINGMIYLVFYLLWVMLIF